MSFKVERTFLTISLMILILIPSLTRAESKAADFNAFQISKEKNGNIVKYDVKLNADCSIASDDPLSIYWMIQDKAGKYHRKEMNFIENGYYGLSITKKNTHQIDGQVKSLKNRNIDVELSIQASKASKRSGCVVQTLGSGSELREPIHVSSIKLENFHGQIPRQVAVIGKKTDESKAPVQYQISLK